MILDALEVAQHSEYTVEHATGLNSDHVHWDGKLKAKLSGPIVAEFSAARFVK